MLSCRIILKDSLGQMLCELCPYFLHLVFFSMTEQTELIEHGIYENQAISFMFQILRPIYLVVE